MGFETVTAKEVKLSKNIPPVGDYTFQLLPGAHVAFNEKKQTNELVLCAAVAEGEQAGKRIFVRYPDPDASNQNGKKNDWSNQAMKKLQIVLGIDPNEGEFFPEYFARVGAGGLGRFGASVVPNIYTDKNTGQQVEGDPKFNVFSVRAAA